MKKITKILSVALVAMMVLSVSAVALADTPSVYIPKKLGKLVDAFAEDYQFPSLWTKVTALATVTDKNGDPVPSSTCFDAYTGKAVNVKSITEDSVMQFHFSEKPDYFGCVLSALDGGYANIEIDDSGYGELEIGELHRQAPKYGEFVGGKDYGTYSVEVGYARDGSANWVTVTLKDSEDFFRTGMEGGVMSITFEQVTVETKCGPLVDELDDDGEPTGNKVKKYDNFTTFWFVSNVSATYPEGNYIVGVETDWRNDSKQNLASYRIAYAPSENEVYKITYAPNTTTIIETHTYDERTGKLTGIEYETPSEYMGFNLNTKKFCEWFIPSENLGNGEFAHHYTADEAIYGEYYRNGSKVAISGSGNNLNKWYKPGHGAQVRNVKKGTTSFKSPRVY
jgi:hypothetical protein